MVPEERVAEILMQAPDLTSAGRVGGVDQGAAGGKDNITVVLFSLEEVGAPGAPPDPTLDQATMAGARAPHAGEVRAALEQRGAPAPPPQPQPRSAVRRRTPRMPAPAARHGRRRLPRPRLGAVIALVIVAVIVAGVWVGTQTIYFVGTNAEGLVTVYRGVPYELPAGLHLYSTNFVSGVDAAQLSTRERHRLLDHTLRSHDDATDLVRRLELGQLQPR
jgi:protein phosphatase